MKRNAVILTVLVLMASLATAGWLGDLIDDFFLSIEFPTGKVGATSVQKGDTTGIVVGIEANKLNAPLSKVANLRGWAWYKYETGYPTNWVSQVDGFDDTVNLGFLSDTISNIHELSDMNTPITSINSNAEQYSCSGCVLDGGGTDDNSQSTYTINVPTNQLTTSPDGLGRYYLIGYVCYGDTKSSFLDIRTRLICDAAVKDVFVYNCGDCGGGDEICLATEVPADEQVVLFDKIVGRGEGVCRSKETACEFTSNCKSLAQQGRTPELDAAGYGIFSEAAHCEKGDPDDPIIEHINDVNQGTALGTCQPGAVLNTDCEAIFGGASNYNYKDLFDQFHAPSSWGVDSDGRCILGECGSVGDCASIHDSDSSEWACVTQVMRSSSDPSGKIGVCKRKLTPEGDCTVGDHTTCPATCPDGTVNYCWPHGTTEGVEGFCACSETAPPPGHCSDGTKNFGETGKDCGGDCAPCGEYVVPSHCLDGLLSIDEQGPDCGGVCPTPCSGTLPSGAAPTNIVVWAAMVIAVIMVVIALFVVAVVLLTGNRKPRSRGGLSA